MSFDIWSALFGAFGLGVLKLIFDVYKYRADRIDKEKLQLKEFQTKEETVQQLFYDLLTGAVRIQEIIEELADEIGAARIIIFKIENGGGVPQLGTIQHISIMNEYINHQFAPPSGNVHPIKHDFQHYVLEQSYQKNLVSMMSEKIHNYDVDHMGDSVFKKLYQSQDIKREVLLHITNLPMIGSDPNKGFLIFMSIQFCSNIKITSKIESEYTIAQEKIKSIYHSFYIKRLQKLS